MEATEDGYVVVAAWLTVEMKTVGVGEMVSSFGENYGLVVSGFGNGMCWKGENDDEVERERR